MIGTLHGKKNKNPERNKISNPIINNQQYQNQQGKSHTNFKKQQYE